MPADPTTAAAIAALEQQLQQIHQDLEAMKKRLASLEAWANKLHAWGAPGDGWV